MGAFFSGGKGWITEPRRFSAWFGCPPKAAAFAKLLPTGFRRRKAGSEPPPPLQEAPNLWCRLFALRRGGFTNHGALARGSAVRRRRQLSRSCCRSALEDEKREANLHPIYGRQSYVRFSVVGRGGLPNHGALARGSAIRKAVAFAKLLPTYSRRRKAGSEPPPPYKRHPKMGAFFSGGKGWITEPRRFSAWFDCPPKAAAFAKLLPIGSRRRKAGSEPPPHIRTSK